LGGRRWRAPGEGTERAVDGAGRRQSGAPTRRGGTRSRAQTRRRWRRCSPTTLDGQGARLLHKKLIRKYLLCTMLREEKRPTPPRRRRGPAATLWPRDSRAPRRQGREPLQVPPARQLKAAVASDGDGSSRGCDRPPICVLDAAPFVGGRPGGSPLRPRPATYRLHWSSCGCLCAPSPCSVNRE